VIFCLKSKKHSHKKEGKCRLFKGMQVTRIANFVVYQLGDNYSCARLEFTGDARYFAIYYLSTTEAEESV
jgi:hypothetical protein